MPPLIRYMIARLLIGSAIGLGFAVALIYGPLRHHSLSAQELETWLMVYGLASTFALGFLATALAFDAEG